MYKQLLKRREFLCARIDECLQIINNAPPGKLEIYKNRSNTKWYFKPDDGERIYLPKKEYRQAAPLARKRLAQSQLVILRKELHAINLYLRHAPKESEYMTQAKTETRFSELLGIVDPNSWQDQPFKSNNSFTDNLKHQSPSGHLLRSKSECLIDMALFNRHIPFRYECELNLSGNSIFPDFTIFNKRTGECRYWEHFGMMDDYKYRKKAFEKTELYLSCGLIPGDDVWFTYETSTSPLTMSAINRVIDEIEMWLD